ncbi:2017_t:CDS:10 [Ambispora gerdemannii]|uniref:3,4-dihydroxy-2-butanone 4-phosphate synthase n=1 Tax=Ambispora gerdemannii TaxID=144530 RepID=A0A9N9BGH9_9GLOM|nr:2017_t:CDS:10 [Ambispora gerdemannii]
MVQEILKVSPVVVIPNEHSHKIQRNNFILNGKPKFAFDSIENALKDFAEGEFVIVVDNEDRENEGDLIIAAEKMTTEKMAFMVRYTSGLICVPTVPARLDQLKLPLMVPNSTDRFKTAYTISVDYKHNITTGISAHDRALTARSLANFAITNPEEFIRPGHMFPLRYTEGGVLKRIGHTEASVDLCKLSGLKPVGVISELVKDDGLMARRDDCRAFADEHGLKLITDEETLNRTWNLVAELCTQLASNREQIQSLEQQVIELQNRADEFTGPLIRASIRAPPFESGTSEIERQNVRLIYENQQLNEENASLSSLVKEYETTLQVMMSKFRLQAHEIQQSKLQMQREYESLLEKERRKNAQISLENVQLHLHLTAVGNLVRQAYDVQTDLDTEILLESLCIENLGLREMLGIDPNNTHFQDEKVTTSISSTPTTSNGCSNPATSTKLSSIDGIIRSSSASNKNTISNRDHY